MLLAGTNYTVIYFGLQGKWKRVWKYDEFKAYLAFILILILIVSGVLWLNEQFPIEQAIREGAFTVVSIVTTTGYVVGDYTAWTPWLTLFFFILMFSGANAGSTSGGIKFVRHFVFGKNIYLEFKRLLHPRAVIPLKLNGNPVPGKILINILVFLLLYMGIFIIGSIICMILGLDFITAIGATATSLGNVGPGIGEVGPVDNFAHLSTPIKWFLSLIMVLGRLEIFTILILFLPYFWRMK
jgi:trk system potassium uptake protein TrkH